MTGEPARRGLLDTNIMILRSRIAPDELPDEMAISAVTLAELSAGPHEVRPDTEQDIYFEAAERPVGSTCCSGLSTSSTRSPSTPTPPGPTGG
jgi:hypothetical protein